MTSDDFTIIIFTIGIFVGIMFGILLSAKRDHLDEFIKEMDNYDAFHVLNGRANANHAKISELALSEKDACPITHWTYFWNQVLARMQWISIRKKSAENSRDRFMDLNDTE